VRRARVNSARPRHSEHQLGTTIDLVLPRLDNEFSQSMWDTAEVRWLAAHAHEYGFVFSYPDGKSSLTGYSPEPWHLRWVGVTHATAIWNIAYLNSGNSNTVKSYLLSLK
jgi:D-alanyl-D-alanine carboxypeptidase